MPDVKALIARLALTAVAVDVLFSGTYQAMPVLVGPATVSR
jgi:hypothetical protein